MKESFSEKLKMPAVAFFISAVALFLSVAANAYEDSPETYARFARHDYKEYKDTIMGDNPYYGVQILNAFCSDVEKSGRPLAEFNIDEYGALSRLEWRGSREALNTYRAAPVKGSMCAVLKGVEDDAHEKAGTTPSQEVLKALTSNGPAY
jgi:hypothetical protein